MRFRCAIAGAVLFAAACSGPEHRVNAGTPIRHDDFVLTVQSVARAALANGTAYDVKIAVENQAKRVDYNWRDEIAYVVDDRGTKYSPASRRSLTVGPGRSAFLTVHFALPAGARNPRLRFWDGIFMGDVFNLGAYGRAAVPLN